MREDTDWPAQVGPYKICGRLGGGGMGVVYRAERDGRVVALKTVRPRPGALAGLRREVAALAALRHPGVVRIVDHGVEDGWPWMAMEWLQGPSLAEVLAAATGDLATRLSVMRHLCEALAYVHGEGLIHRDLKPANVIVTDARAAVLVDFGLQERATRREVLGATAPWSGTRGYMAPEQLRGERGDARSDLYALGCLLYESITGRRLFAGPPEAVAMQHVHASPAPPMSLCPDIDPQLDALVTALLAKRRGDRPGSARIVARTLDAVGVGPMVWADLPTTCPYLYRPELIGRAEPLEVLGKHLQDASVVLLGGESGEGKTRLAMELADRARRQGTRVVAGACRDHVPLPLEGFLQPLLAVADRCRAFADESGAVLGNRAGVLAQYQPALQAWVAEPPVRLPAVQARHRLLSYLCETLASFATDRPLLLVIDDLQWADELTLAALRRLKMGVPGVSVLGLYRTEEASEALCALRDELPHVILSRLDPSSVSSIVADMLAWPAPPERLWQRLASHSEGNPLYVGEYLHAALQSGLLSQGVDGGWQLASDPEAFQLPRSLRDLVGRRLRGLPDDARRLVVAAAVLGREVDDAVLQRTAGMEADRCSSAIAELFRRHVLEEGGGAVRFNHDKIREVTLAGLEQAERTDTHRAAALAIEALCGDSLEAHHADLGLHWEIGGDAKKAVQYYETAAHSAGERHANSDAQQLYSDALRLVDSPEEIARLRMALGETYARRGEYTGAVAQQQAALAAARAMGARQLEAKALARLGNALRFLGKFEEGHDALQQAIALQRSMGDELGEAKSFDMLGSLDLANGRLSDALASFEVALAIMERVGSPLEQARIIGHIGTTVILQGRLAEAEQLSLRSLDILRELGDRYECRHQLFSLATVYGERGQLDRAEKLYLEGLDLYRAVGDRFSTAMGLDNLALLYLERDQGERAIGIFEEVLTIRRELQDRRGEGVTLGNLGIAAHVVENLEMAVAQLEEAIIVHREAGNRKYLAAHQSNLAEVRGDLGEFERADALYTKAIAQFDELGIRLPAAASAANQLRCRRWKGWPPEQLSRDLEALEHRFSELELSHYEIAAVCEFGHVALVCGGDGRHALERAERLCEQHAVSVEDGGELASCFARLRRAIENPGRLLRGECPEDLPDAVRRQLEGG